VNLTKQRWRCDFFFFKQQTIINNRGGKWPYIFGYGLQYGGAVMLLMLRSITFAKITMACRDFA